MSFLRGSGELIGDYTDIESGKRSNRPELMKAIEHCKRKGGGTNGRTPGRMRPTSVRRPWQIIFGPPGRSWSAIAIALNEYCFLTRRGKQFQAVQVQRVVELFREDQAAA